MEQKSTRTGRVKKSYWAKIETGTNPRSYCDGDHLPYNGLDRRVGSTELHSHGGRPDSTGKCGREAVWKLRVGTVELHLCDSCSRAVMRRPWEPPKCIVCGKDTFDDYMVEHHVWREQAKMPHRGHAHFECLEERLGRNLHLDDLMAVPVNNVLRLIMWREKEESLPWSEE